MEENMEESIDNERIFSLTDKLKDILEQYLLKDPAIAGSKMEEAKNIRRELESMGFLVEWIATFKPETFELEVEVKLWKPKSDMSPEDRAIYDKWLLSKAGIRDDS
jgi:hypothetical protein